VNIHSQNWIVKEVMREANEIEMHPNNMNKEDDLILSTAWKPLLHILKEKRDKNNNLATT
jgi:hypothetical protein